MKKLFHDFGIVGILLKWLFGVAFCGREGESISANKLIALTTFVYGLIKNDLAIIGIAVGHFGYKAGVDSWESTKHKSIQMKGDDSVKKDC